MSRIYPDFISAFMEYSEYVEAPEVFLKWSAISAMAGALERKVWINFKNQSHCYPNMYIMLVGPPGLVKKSVSSGMSVNILKSVPDLRFGGTRLTAASLVEDLRKSGLYHWVEFNGEKYHNSSMYLYSSEAAVTLKEVQGSVIELLTDFWDCNPNGWYTEEDGNCWKQSLKGEGESKIFNPCLNILACSTPVWLVNSLGRENLESGFASRIIFVVHNSRTKRNFSWADEVPDRQFMRKDLVADLTHISQLKGEFNVSMDFKRAFDDFDNKHKDFLEKNAGDVLIGYHSRKPWQLLKLCQIIALSRSDTLTVTSVHLNEAMKLLEEIEPEMYKAFDTIDRPEEVKHLVEIFKVLSKEKVPLTKAQIMARFLNKDQNTVNGVLARLCSMKKLRANVKPGNITYEVIDHEPLD